jgi:hypothetical protein
MIMIKHRDHKERGFCRELSAARNRAQGSQGHIAHRSYMRIYMRDADNRLCNGRSRRAIKYVTLADCASDERSDRRKSLPRGRVRPRSLSRTTRGGREGREGQTAAGRRWKTRAAEMWAWHLRGMTAHPSRPSRVLTRPCRMASQGPPVDAPPGFPAEEIHRTEVTPRSY